MEWVESVNDDTQLRQAGSTMSSGRRNWRWNAGLISSVTTSEGLGMNMSWKTIQMVFLTQTALSCFLNFWHTRGWHPRSVFAGLCHHQILRGSKLGQGADIYRVCDKLMEMAHFLVTVRGMMEICGVQWAKRDVPSCCQHPHLQDEGVQGSERNIDDRILSDSFPWEFTS